MTSIDERVRDVIHFYVKANYENYLKEHSLTLIPDDRVEHVIRSLYDDRKEHLKSFTKTSLKQLMGSDYPGDLVILNILVEVFADDDLCRNRLIMEINLHQQTVRGEPNDYRKI
jgi:hypothetical protein